MGRSLDAYEAERAEFARAFGRGTTSRGVIVPLATAELARLRRLTWVFTYRATRDVVDAKPGASGVRERWESGLRELDERTAFVGRAPDGMMTADQCAEFWDALARAALELDSLGAVPDWDTVAISAAEEAAQDAARFSVDLLKPAALIAASLLLVVLVRR